MLESFQDFTSVRKVLANQAEICAEQQGQPSSPLALIAARGDDLATNALAGAAERVARGEGRETLASAVAASRRRRTEASAVGAALHAMHGVAPADGSSGPASVPHLSPCALEAALSGAREAAASLEETVAALVAAVAAATT